MFEQTTKNVINDVCTSLGVMVERHKWSSLNTSCYQKTAGNKSIWWESRFYYQIQEIRLNWEILKVLNKNLEIIDWRPSQKTKKKPMRIINYKYIKL